VCKTSFIREQVKTQVYSIRARNIVTRITRFASARTPRDNDNDRRANHYLARCYTTRNTRLSKKKKKKIVTSITGL